MNRIAVAGVSLALIGVFLALAVSVVSARKPLDGRVSRSFASTISRTTGGSSAVQSVGCTKRRVNFYLCMVEVGYRNGTSLTLNWLMLLHDDGCWHTYYKWPQVRPVGVAKKLGYPRGCGA